MYMDSNANGVIQCHGNISCQYVTLLFVGINDIDVYCHGNESCYGMETTSYSNQSHLDLYCLYGKNVCRIGVINGISSGSINIVCGKNVYTQNSCLGLQIYCPINDINGQSCNIDFGFNAWHSDIYTIYGRSQTNIMNMRSGDNIKIFCGFEWFTDRDRWDNNNCSDVAIFEYMDKLSNNNIALMLPDPYSQNINCQHNTDCVVYVSTKITPLNHINCPPNKECSIVWCVLIYQENSIYVRIYTFVTV